MNIIVPDGKNLRKAQDCLVKQSIHIFAVENGQNENEVAEIERHLLHKWDRLKEGKHDNNVDWLEGEDMIKKFPGCCVCKIPYKDKGRLCFVFYPHSNEKDNENYEVLFLIIEEYVSPFKHYFWRFAKEKKQYPNLICPACSETQCTASVQKDPKEFEKAFLFVECAACGAKVSELDVWGWVSYMVKSFHIQRQNPPKPQKTA